MRSWTERTAPSVERLESRVLLSSAAIEGGGALTTLDARAGIGRSLPSASLSHATAKLSQPLDGISATAVDGKAFFAGGESSPILPFYTQNVDIYDAATRTWSTAKLSLARAHGSGVSVGARALFAGGDSDGAVANALVDVYDAATGEWSTAALSQAYIGGAAVAIAGKAIFVAGGNIGDIADIYDALTGQWSTATLPVPLSSTVGLTVGGLALFPDLSPFDPPNPPPPAAEMDVYNAATNEWSAAPIPTDIRAIDDDLGNAAAAAVVGAKAFFVAGKGGHLDIYNSVTGHWSKFAAPSSLIAVLGSFSRGVSVGTKVLFAGGSSGNNVAVYDTATSRWSAAPISLPRDRVTPVAVGDHALFAGGNSNVTRGSVRLADDVDNVDIYTDLTPAPVLSGYFTGQAGGTVSVTVNNTGDADLRAGATVAVYASRDRTLRHAILLGRVTLPDALAAGASVQVDVPTSIPPSARAGDYHLLAAAGPAHRLTPLAAQTQTFTVGAPAAKVAKASPAGAHASPFALRPGPLHAWPIGR